jgi:hypothetical protein
MKRFLTAFAVVTLAGVMEMRADTIAYEDPAGQGNQNPGYPGNLASNFDVLAPITVTGLGVFNADGSGTIAGTIQVAIFDTSTNLQVTPIVTFVPGSYTLGGFGFDVFQSIAPVVLGIGSYQVDAVGFGSDPDGNITQPGGATGAVLNDGGALSFTGYAFDGSGTLDVPTTCDACIAGPGQAQWDAGTFSFTTASVSDAPEPGSFVLFGSGLIGLSAILRRKLVR